MPKPIPVKVGGISFLCFKHACECHEVLPITVNYRLQRGWSIDEAFGLKEKEYTNFIVAGKGFKDIHNACKFYEVNRATVDHRLKNGWSIEEAFGLVDKENFSKCDGKLYIIHNIVNNKKYVGITVGKLEARFRSHKKDAKFIRSTKFHKALYKIGFDKFYIELVKEVEDRHELYRLEVEYIKKYNSIKNGYNTAVGGGGLGHKIGKEIDYAGVKFNSIKSLADYLNMDQMTIKYRLDNNIPLDRPLHAISGCEIEYNGKIFASTADLARHYNMSMGAAVNRLKKNIPLEAPLGKVR